MARQPQQGEANPLKFPPGFKTFALSEPAGMRYALEPRPGIDDQQLFWQENYIRIGKSSLRTLADVGTALYTAPPGRTIISFFPYNLGTTNYIAVFLDDGTAYQVTDPGGATTTISGVSPTFWASA